MDAMISSGYREIFETGYRNWPMAGGNGDIGSAPLRDIPGRTG